ncbi:hypothetical protein Tco_0652044, partial [Tanacetum coccineum]
ALDEPTFKRLIVKLDIAFATFVCVRYQTRPIEKHLKEVKRIFRYLRQSINMGLWYSKDSGFELIAYSDADHVGCHDDCKSTYGGIQFLGDKLVSWSSKKYLARPTKKHLKKVKRIFRYLRQSINMGLRYSKDSRFELIAYSDADHVGCHDDCKSTYGGI